MECHFLGNMPLQQSNSNGTPPPDLKQALQNFHSTFSSSVSHWNVVIFSSLQAWLGPHLQLPTRSTLVYTNNAMFSPKWNPFRSCCSWHPKHLSPVEKTCKAQTFPWLMTVNWSLFQQKQSAVSGLDVTFCPELYLKLLCWERRVEEIKVLQLNWSSAR